MSTCKIHQIYYSPESFAALDHGFIPLDNSNGCQDWMEYWPIRQYFLNNPTSDDDLLGFFSPRFFEKTGLSAADVHDHIKANPDKDVYLFNPYFHLAAWHPNVFVQARDSHPGLTETINEVMALLDIQLNAEDTIMSSMDSIFCNYFVAKVEFWKSWLIICEFIFQIAENKKSIHGKHLRHKTNYIRGALPMKIFVIERVASLLLNTTKKYKTNSILVFRNMGYKANKPIQFVEEMLALDALKRSFSATNDIYYLRAYDAARVRLRNEFSLFI
jgi:hypothetical protein